jgi:hypothetical protein
MLLGLVSSSSSMAEQQQQETDASTAIKPACILFTERVAPLIQTTESQETTERVDSSFGWPVLIYCERKILLAGWY